MKTLSLLLIGLLISGMSFSQTTELDQSLINKKIKALNLHQMKFDQTPFTVEIEALLPADYEAQKPVSALSFDAGFVNANGKVFVSEPTTTAQKEVFTDINQAAIFYVCQSFLQYYYQATEMPLWFKVGFASYEADMRINDADIKTAYDNYGGTLTSFDVLNNPTTFVANNGFAISYLFGEFIGVFKVWSYNMVQDVNASTIIPNPTWYNAGTIEDLFDYFMGRYFNARILETNEQERLKFGMETEHFKHYYREAEDYWLAYFPDVLEEAITEYMGLMNFEPFEKFSSLTMPICNYVTIGGGECVNLRYTSGTAWSSGIWASSPATDNADDIKSFIHLIRHELAHLVQAQLGAKHMTAWLNEGFAEFMSRGPSTSEEKIALKSDTKKTLNDAINYFGHLPTFEDTKVYPGQTTVNYYLLGQIMQNFIYETGGYAAVREVIINPESAITNIGFSSVDAFMAAYYHYLNVEYLQIPDPDYFTNYDAFITKLTDLTSSVDNADELNTFWNNLIATGNFPFAIATKVAFLYRGTADKINWAGEFNNWDTNTDYGHRLGVSDIWLLEKEFPADARSGYKIVKNGSEWLTDPNNPHPLTGGYGNSELWMPEYVIPPETILRHGIPKGTLTDNILINSTKLGYSCQYRVYTPTGYSTLSNLPTIYVADGQEYLDDTFGKMVIVLDNLIADGIIEPVIAVFLDPRDPNNLSNNRRGDEYRNNINFVNYVTRELIPDIDATYKTNPSADERAMMGASYGGYNAAYFCAKANDYFQMIGMNSAYLHPVGDYTIDPDLQAANLNGMKLYLSYGTFDTQGERYFYRLKNIFDQKGSDYRYNIVGDGHTWENWSRVLSKALEYFFPKSDTISLSLTSPNGGEYFIPGDTMNIKWSATGVSNIKIEFSADNDSNWNSISTSTAATLGSYDWTIPNIFSDQCKIRITDITNVATFDESDSAFEIGAPNNAGGPYAADDNTVLLMHFDGNLTNSSTLSSDGVPIGSGISYSYEALANQNQCLNLDGSSYVTIPHNTNLNLNGDWTIEAWIKVTAFNSGTQSIIVRKPGDSDDYNANYNLELHPWWGNVLNGFYFSDDATRINVTEMSPTLDKWYHVAFIRNTSKSDISIVVHDEDWNEVSSSSQNYSGNDVLFSSKDLRIGEAFDGYIDELRISNVVRDFSTPSNWETTSSDNFIFHYTKPELLTTDLILSLEKELKKLDNTLWSSYRQVYLLDSTKKINIYLYDTDETFVSASADLPEWDIGYYRTAENELHIKVPSTARQIKYFPNMEKAALSVLSRYVMAKKRGNRNEPSKGLSFGFGLYESGYSPDTVLIQNYLNTHNNTFPDRSAISTWTQLDDETNVELAYTFSFASLFRGGYFNVTVYDGLYDNQKDVWYQIYRIFFLTDIADGGMKKFYDDDDFIIYSNSQEVADLSLEALRWYADQYELAYGVRINHPVLVTMYGSDETYRYTQRGNIDNIDVIGGGGEALSHSLLRASPATKNLDTEMDRVLTKYNGLIGHEFMHNNFAFLASASTVGPPSWLNEGSAMYGSVDYQQGYKGVNVNNMEGFHDYFWNKNSMYFPDLDKIFEMDGNFGYRMGTSAFTFIKNRFPKETLLRFMKNSNDFSIIGYSNIAEFQRHLYETLYHQYIPTFLFNPTWDLARTYTSGTTYSFNWDGHYIDNLIIEYSTDSMNSWNSIAEVPFTDGSYSWTIPNTANCILRFSDKKFPDINFTFQILGNRPSIGKVFMMDFENGAINKISSGNNGSGKDYILYVPRDSKNGNYAKFNGLWNSITVQNYPKLNLNEDWTIQGDFLIENTSGVMNQKPVLLEKISSGYWAKNYSISFNNKGLKKLRFEYRLENNQVVALEVDAGITNNNWYTFYFARSVQNNKVEARVYDQNGTLLGNEVRQLNGEGKVLTDPGDLYLGSGDFYVNERCLQGGLDNIIISDTYSDKLLSDSVDIGTGFSESSYDYLISLFPNPASKSISISSPEIVTLSIFNLSGQKITERKNFSNGNIDVSYFKKGIYVIRFSCNKGVVSRKLIIE